MSSPAWYRPQRCPHCRRVRLEPGGPFVVGELAGFVEVLGCDTCAALEAGRLAAARVRGEKEVERRAAQGFGPAPDEQDAFRGFRGESEGGAMGDTGQAVNAVIVGSAQELATTKPSASSGAMALANMSDAEFEARLEAARRGVERVRQLQRSIMAEHEDFGTIPGTQKPTLLKPGAEKLAAFYGLVAVYEVSTAYGDGNARPWITVNVRAIMRLGSADGPIIGEGLGSANSSEAKHRYRSAKRACPTCGSAGGISKSKFADRATGGIGWYCRDCKANYHSADPAIVDQALGQVVNPDPADVENTCLKVGKKRAYIDGVLTTTATSGLFTQDLEDLPATGDPATGDPAASGAPASGAPASSSRAAAPARTSSAAGPGPAPCPKCHKAAPPSKYARPGDGKPTHYCTPCREKFTPAAAAPAPLPFGNDTPSEQEQGDGHDDPFGAGAFDGPGARG